MKNHLYSLILLSVGASAVCLAQEDCPRTIGSTDPGGWYGADAFSARLPAGGVWPTTAPGHLIAVKLVWRSAGFSAGMESNLAVTVKPLNGARATAIVSGNANAVYAEDFGGWAMMTGIDFPDAGCWEITGRYRGEELRFVVETVRSPSP